MWTVADLQRLFKKESWQIRIAYSVMMLLALVYLLTQILTAIVWLAGQAPLDSV